MTLLSAAALLGSGCALPKDTLPPAPPTGAGAVPGGAVTVGITRPAGVDPLNFHEPASMLVASALCETLVVADPDTGELRPGLVKKWTVVDEGQRIIFQLRKDAYFHDGRQVKSADIVEAWRRLASPENVVYVGELLAGVRGFDRYRKAVEEGEPLAEFQGLRIIEPFSFEVFLAEKDPDFLRVMTHPALAPVSKSPYDVDAGTAPAHPQCAGPYRLESAYQPGANEIVLRRFERYHANNAVFARNGKGFVDEIRLRVYPDPEAVYQAFARGEVDVAGVPAGRFAEARARFGDRVAVGDLPQEEFIALPYGESSPFRDANVRKALSQALDRSAIVRDVYGGARRPATGFIPPALTTVLRSRGGGVREVGSGCPELSPTALPDLARESWRKAKEAEESRPSTPAVPAIPPTADPALPAAPAPPTGQAPPAGPPAAPTEPAAPVTSSLKLYFNDEANHRTLAEAVAAQWRAVLGVEVHLVALGWEEFLQQATSGPGFNGAFRLSHVPLYSGVQPFLRPLFHGESRGGTNLQRYTNVAFDTTYDDDVKPVVDDFERTVRYGLLEKMLCDDLPIIPIAFGQTAYVTGPRVAAARESGRMIGREGSLLLRELAVAQSP